MATMQQLMDALRNADAAGDTAGAQRIAQIIQEQRSAGGQNEPQHTQPDDGVIERVTEEEALRRSGLVGQPARRYAEQQLGVDPNIVARGDILPIGRTAEGEIVPAVPEMLLAPARAFFLPAAALEGIPVSIEDATNFALSFGPAAVGRTPGVAGAAKRVKPGKITNKQIAKALNSAQLKEKSRGGFEAFKQSGTNMKSDAYASFLVNAERNLVDEGIDPKLHPRTASVMENLVKELGDDVSPQTLINKRRIINASISDPSIGPDDKRLLTQTLQRFDDYVENLPGADQWKKSRRIYSMAMKQEMVEDALDKASRQASGIENGLRIALRGILNNPNKAKRFSKAERAVMDKVVKGDFTTNTLKRLSKIGAGAGQQTNVLGATAATGVGAGVGGSVGGPVGAAIGATVPVVAGSAASKALQARQQRALGTLQALISGERPVPRVSTMQPAQRMSRAIGGALSAAQLPEDENNGQ